MKINAFHINGWLCAAAFCLLGIFVSPGSAAEPEQNQGKLEDVLIRDKDTMKVTSEKAPFVIDIDVLKDVAGMDQSLLDRREEIPRVSTEAVLPPLVSQGAVSPWLNAIVADPVMTFPGIEGAQVSRWQLHIVDTQGKPFKRFAGKGAKSNDIPWNGRGDKDRFMSVGALYSYYTVTFDKNGKKSTGIVRPFKVDAAMRQEKDVVFISIALPSLFDPGKDSRELSPDGERLLTEAADIIKGYYPRPFTMKIFDENKERALAASDSISRYVAGQLLLPPGQIKREAYQGVPNTYRIDIVIDKEAAGKSLYQPSVKPQKTLSSREAVVKIQYAMQGSQQNSGSMAVNYWDAFRADYSSDITGSNQVNAGLAVSGEGVAYLSDHVGVGLGLTCQFPRENADRGGTFNFVPLYGLIKLRAAGKHAVNPYVIGQLGYNLFYADDAFAGAGATRNKGMYYGLGCGVKIRRFQVELLYSSNKANIQRSGEDRSALYSFTSSEDIDYKTLSWSLGYVFD